MLLAEIFRKFKFWLTADRLGPDMPLTHIGLYFPSTMKTLCKKRFKHFGEGAEFRPGAYALSCSKISIGNRVVIRAGCMLGADMRQEGGGITIEDDVMLGPSVYFFCNNHKFTDSDVPIIDQGYVESRHITLKKGCWIGANSVILQGVTIGRNAVVGASSVVTKDVPDKVVVAGNPACIVKEL
ncbi:MAG: acyltransferase [bacterium]